MKHRIVGNGLSETVDREAIFDKKFIFASFSKNLILLCKSDFRKAGLIIYIALDTFPRFDFLTDFHIDERGKIKEDELSQGILVTTYTKTGLTTQS